VRSGVKVGLGVLLSYMEIGGGVMSTHVVPEESNI
jgi:hypothetical protein